ncbi:MAG TPA: glycosyltransferase family 39 protein [Polyangiales bacterium]
MGFATSDLDSTLSPTASAKLGRRAVWFLLLAMLTSLAVGYRLQHRSNSRIWNADEGISYVVSTCHSNEYRDDVTGTLSDQWLPAPRWKRLVQPGPQFCFRQIATDLSESDVHPPLYFWALHVWTHFFGNDLSAGFGLNCAFVVLELLALAGLSRSAGLDAWVAAGGVALFSLNGVSANSGLEMRPYALLGFVSVAHVVAAFRMWRSPRERSWREMLGLALSVLAGILTSYLFVYELLTTALAGLAVTGLRDRRRLLQALSATVVALGVAWALFPFGQQLVLHHAGQVQFAGFGARMLTALKTVGLVAPHPLGFVATTVAFLFVGAGFVVVDVWRHGVRGLQDRGTTLVVGITLILTSALIFQYCVGLSPVHAMGPKYMAAVWPMLCLSCVAMVNALPHGRILVVVVVLAGTAPQLPASWIGLGQAPLRLRHRSDSVVVLDSTNRLHLPRVLPLLPDTAQVLVADYRTLLTRADLVPTAKSFWYWTCTPTAATSRGSRDVLHAWATSYTPGRPSPLAKSWKAVHLVRTR